MASLYPLRYFSSCIQHLGFGNRERQSQIPAKVELEGVSFGKEVFKELRALGGAWAGSLKAEITQNDGRVWGERGC